MIDKQESRRIQREIRNVLLQVWDPIGVKDEPNAQDEYDCCIGPLFSLLTQHKTDDAIIKYLRWAVEDHMGLGRATREEMLPTVRALRAIPVTATRQV